MPASAVLRRGTKQLLQALLNESCYDVVRTIALAWDIRSGKRRGSEIELLPLGVGEGDVVLDVGAEHGLYSYHLARLVGRAGGVYAFEPIPATFRRLRRIGGILRLRSVEYVQKACGDSSGVHSFCVPIAPSGVALTGYAHLAGRQNDTLAESSFWDRTQFVRAELIRLDDFLPEHGEVTFLKIDVEGAEFLVLKGACRLIERCRPTILCEVVPHFMEAYGVSVVEFLNYLATRGYQCYRYARNRGRRALHPVRPEDVGPSNYLFIHPSRAGAFRPLLAPGKEP